MYFSTFEEFLRNGRDLLAKGPVAMIFAEDEVELDTTLRHHRDAGFAQVLLFAPDAFIVPDDLKDLPQPQDLKRM